MSEPAADQKEIDKARALFKAFQYREARPGEIIRVGGLSEPAIALAVGTTLSLGYKALGNGKDYYHEFEGTKPRLFVNAAGDQIFLIGGSYRFSGRGFIR